eukprot:7907949-Alexandrium_andersonii.AAC.1
MASIRKADLARRHGQCGSSRFWQPYRGGSQQAATGQGCTMAVLPGRLESSASTCATAAPADAPGTLRAPSPPRPLAARPPRRGCTGQRMGCPAAVPPLPCCGASTRSPGAPASGRGRRPHEDSFGFVDHLDPH